MAAMTTAHWLMVVGAGSIWIGALIVWVGGLPRQMRTGPIAEAEPGTSQAFMLFWLDQYSYLGIALVLVGALMLTWGLLR